MSHQSEPYFTRIDEFGTIEATWPDPPLAYYAVAHEVLSEIVEKHNRAAALRKRLSQSDWIVCAEALRILDGNPCE